MSFTSETRPRSRPILPLAAMVDVLFLLLIFFMTVSTFREQETQIDVALTAAETGETSGGRATQIVVSIDAENQVYLGPRPVEVDELKQALVELSAEFPGEAVVVRADEAAATGVTVSVIDAARASGVGELDLATVEPLEE